jgi:Putative lumazine-binding
MTTRTRAIPLALAALCAALGVSACGEASSTGSYKGESQHVAQTIASLQSDATAASAGKVCGRDLAASVVRRVEAAGKSCKQALEGQLREIDTYSLTVESISVQDAKATAKVKSTWSGKERVHTLSFVKEDGHWKIAALS